MIFAFLNTKGEDMTREHIAKEIRRLRNLFEQRKSDLLKFVADESWWNVMIATSECVAYQKLIEEYEYLDELEEYNGAE